MDEYYRVIRQLPAWLAQPLGGLPPQSAANIQELRLRQGCGITLTMRGRQCPINTLEQCPRQLAELRLSEMQMEEIFHTLCGGSVHTHQAELAQGYLTTPAGCRVGVAGSFVERAGQDTVLQMVTSLNLRIARMIQIALPERLRHILQEHFTGLLVIGEPGSGKTTVLRQIAAELAAQGKAVAVIDERRELFPPEAAALCRAVDCLSGLPKQKAVQAALRTLSPQVILLDELGDLAEVHALEQGFFSGVDFIASVHAPDLAEALRRPQVRVLRQKGMLHAAVQLSCRETPGHIREVCML